MPTIFAYFSPETSLPVVSAIAAVVGFGLTMVRLSVSVMSRWFRITVRKPR